jgi:segregation and condensation protein A
MSEDYRVDIPIFQGPLDLLLSLIEREELDITQVSLAQVTDQYLAYLDQLEQAQMALMADFIVIAAKLVLIKSRALLPQPVATATEGEQDLGQELVEQLRRYKQFKIAAGKLGERYQQGLRTFLRLAPPPRIEPQPDLSDVTLADLMVAVREALNVIPPADPVGTVITRRKITTDEQMVLIRQRCQQQRHVIFQELLLEASGRVEIAVTLLALLELLKRREVTVHQERLFGNILIEAGERLGDSAATHTQDDTPTSE